jgi:hypothetical protein
MIGSKGKTIATIIFKHAAQKMAIFDGKKAALLFKRDPF